MAKIGRWGGMLALLVLAGAPGAAAEIYEIDYATYDVRVTDTQGVTTAATDFGFYSGPNILNARRGDAYVEIPFRKVRSIEIGEYVPERGVSPMTVTARSGRTLQLELERFEGQRFLGGTSDVGSYRIRLAQVRRLDLIALSHHEEDGRSEPAQ